MGTELDTISDAQAFVEFLRELHRSPWPELGAFFDLDEPVSVARAPGRLDVMGGIADYSGALVLQLPTREATLVAAQRHRHPDWQIVSLPPTDGEPLRWVRIPASERAAWGHYATARQWFSQASSSAWAAYLAGVVLVAGQELGADIDCGLRLLVRSSVPEARGVSSSAALEVAAMRALADCLGIVLDGFQAARLCQMAENLVVGAPCGIMDQMTSALGQPHKLLALLCQPAEIEGFVNVPESLGIWGLDSGIRHAVSGSDYTSVRTGAFMGYRMIAEMANLRATHSTSTAVVQIDDPRWQGYLANLSPSEFEASYAAVLPEQMFGAAFLERFQGTTDRVTQVDPDRCYAIRRPTAHPVYEHARVTRFRELLTGQMDDATPIAMGELMYASHDSYSACGLGSSGTDRLVEMVREAGPAAGLFGAKITGGGSGGTVAVLGRKTARSAVEAIARRYAEETGHEDYVFYGSSPGAWNDVVCRVRL